MVYGACGQEQVFTIEGNSTAGSPDRVKLQLSLPSVTNCYTYIIAAYDGTSTAMVEGRVDLSGKHIILYMIVLLMVHNIMIMLLAFCTDEGSTNVAAIVVPIVVILMLIVVVVAITIVLVIWKFRSRDHKEDYCMCEGKMTRSFSTV